jgi:hypothetical protein
MLLQKVNTWLRVGLVILAALVVGAAAIRATENPIQPRDGYGVPARNLKLRKNTKSKDKKSNAANVNQKNQTDSETQAGNQSQPDSAKEIAQLKQQLALQQQQIAQLLHAVNQLQAEVVANRTPMMASSVVQPSRSVAPVSTVRSSGDNEVASLTPILPPLPKAQADGPNQVQAVSTPMNLPQAEQSGTAGLQAGEKSRTAVTSSESSPAGQDKKSGPLDLDNGKIKIGATFFGLYRYYANTGFGPQILTLLNTPGPGNGGFNSFDVDRTYINFVFSPNDALSFRVTPNIYRQYSSASGVKLGSTSATGSTENGNLVLRLKYAYVDYNTLFGHSKTFGKDKLTFGQQQQPLTDWEEGLYGYRFVNLTPWNYLSLSSTYPGVKLHGPIEFNGKQYLDYEVGVFNDQSFHAYETGDKKQVMTRLSYYPMGAVSKYQGLGFTGFVDYGYKDAAPDTNTKVPITRVAALVHYTTKSNDYGIAAEYDYGRNAFSTGNLFSGSGPADAFGYGPTQYAPFNSLTAALLGGTHTNQRGFDFFGHARLGKSPFYLFGMFEQFNPNTHVRTNPLDFRTVVGGISYKYGKYWEFALDSQNVMYYHGQFTFPASELAQFSPSLAASNPNGIPNAVPDNSNAIFFNVLFNY